MPAVAVYAVTRKGARLSRRLAEALDGEQFLPRRLAGEPGVKSFDSLPECLAETFNAFRGHIFVCAAGIAVRAIAPHLQSKALDPAVVVLDEAGRFAVSLLSGHLGGANDLAMTVAEAVGATPVVTTATDNAGVPAVDLLARRRGMAVADASKIKHVSAALLEGRRVTLFDPEDHLGARDDPAMAEHFEHVSDPALLDPDQPSVWAHWKQPPRALNAGLLLALHPRVLAAGVGCRRGASKDEILEAIEMTLRQRDYALAGLGCLASIDLKAHEPGLVAAARELHLQLRTFPAAELDRMDAPGASPRVKDKVGTASVSEASALLAAGPGARLLIPKRIMGNVTVAVALSPQPLTVENTWRD
ncbi:cobalt-precorrin 5A hydrolase [Desulfocurvibacter africanus]|uniref:cobalt-precorrin 5A hydrolase n=1 Tax=Desulfocurvibacter africanus TaxID=873 RepID=UPI000418402C|nr:cobalamin biosynthesis protein [Desulfocurvibacter africanus]